MSDSQQYLTSEKLEEFKKELNYLITEKRKQVVENLEYTRKLGDLSENAEYQEARQAQAEVEGRIGHLENLIKTALIVDGQRGDLAGIGSTVKIQKVGEKDIRTYLIVGSEESDMATGKISNISPLGQALVGKKSGDTLNVITPKGSISYKLISLE
jgi:transcription elongation factor GreA